MTFDRAWELRDESAPADPMWALVGVGEDTLRAHGPGLATGTPGFVVAGPPSSGRSTVLLTMARSLPRTGVEIVVVAPAVADARLGTEGATVLTGPGLGSAEPRRLGRRARTGRGARRRRGAAVRRCACGAVAFSTVRLGALERWR